MELQQCPATPCTMSWCWSRWQKSISSPNVNPELAGGLNFYHILSKTNLYNEQQKISKALFYRFFRKPSVPIQHQRASLLFSTLSHQSVQRLGCQRADNKEDNMTKKSVSRHFLYLAWTNSERSRLPNAQGKSLFAHTTSFGAIVAMNYMYF